MYKKERDALKEMRKIDKYDMKNFSTLDSRETIAILGDRPQTAKQEGDEIINKRSTVGNIWRQRIEGPTVGGVSIGSRNGVPSRKRCVVNGQMTKAGNKRARPPLPPRREGYVPIALDGSRLGALKVGIDATWRPSSSWVPANFHEQGVYETFYRSRVLRCVVVCCLLT